MKSYIRLTEKAFVHFTLRTIKVIILDAPSICPDTLVIKNTNTYKPVGIRFSLSNEKAESIVEQIKDVYKNESVWDTPETLKNKCNEIFRYRLPEVAGVNINTLLDLFMSIRPLFHKSENHIDYPIQNISVTRYHGLLGKLSVVKTKIISNDEADSSIEGIVLGYTINLRNGMTIKGFHLPRSKGKSIYNLLNSRIKYA